MNHLRPLRLVFIIQLLAELRDSEGYFEALVYKIVGSWFSEGSCFADGSTEPSRRFLVEKISVPKIDMLH